MSTVQPASPAVQQIPLDQIVPSPYQARRTFDEAKLQELAQSMKERTQLTPINVRPVGDHYELVAGERRWRAARLLGWNTLQAIVEPIDNQEAALRGLVENLQRQDLNPIERALGYKRLSDPPFNLNQEAIARESGLTDRTLISRYLALLELPQEVQDFVSRDTISEGHVRYLARIKDPVLFLKTARDAASEGWSIRETERQVDQLLGKPPEARPKASEIKRAARQGIDQALKDYGFQFAADGPRIVITAILDRFNGDIGIFFEKFQTALMLWISQHPYQGQAADPPDTATSGDSSGLAEEPSEAEQIRMAQEIIAKYGRIG